MQLSLGVLAQQDLEALLCEFEAEDLLGSGGMARVWGTQSRATGERVAIKVMDDSRAGVSCERFLLEAALLSSAGGLLGLTVGTLLVAIGNLAYPTVDLVAPVWAVVSVIALSLGTGILFGVLPAWRASRLS